MAEKYDLHTHWFTRWGERRTLLEPSSRDPDRLLTKVADTGMDGVALIDFYDRRYERFAEALKSQKGKWRLEANVGNALLLTDEDRRLSIIRGEEVPTHKNGGHILVLGGHEGEFLYQSRYDLQGLLKRTRNLGLPAGPAHPLNYHGIGQEKLERFAREFHFFEYFNGNFPPIDDPELLGMLSSIPLNGLFVSDSHALGDIASAYILTLCESIDFGSESRTIESLSSILTGDAKFTGFTNEKKGRNYSTNSHIALAIAYMAEDKARKIMHLARGALVQGIGKFKYPA